MIIEEPPPRPAAAPVVPPVRPCSALGSILVAPAGASIGPPGISSSRTATRPVAPSTNCRTLISTAVSLPLSSQRSSTIGRSFGGSWDVSEDVLLSPAAAGARRLSSEYALVGGGGAVRGPAAFGARGTGGPSA